MRETRQKGFEDDEIGLDIRAHEIAEASENAQKRLLDLQLKMAASSINHEYARQKFDEIADRTEREDLLDYMNDCHREYNEARAQLAAFDPYALADFEADLIRQKQTTVAHYSA